MRAPGEHEKAAIALFTLALVLLVLAFLLGRRDLVGATLVLCAAAAFFTAILLLTFTKESGIDPGIAALLPVEGAITICSIAGELGLQERGYVLEDPWSKSSGHLIHWIAAGAFQPPQGVYKGIFHATEGSYGMAIEPAGAPLLKWLKGRHALQIPEVEEGIFIAMREVLEDALELADAVSISRVNEDIVVEIQGFRLMSGCEAVRSASPRCCTMYPCPVCSLLACIMVKGMKKPVALAEVGVDEEHRTLKLLYSSSV
ncbi:MAG: hypothetical protein QHG99_02365 [Methanomicrobiales archaeon]|nr:hypothetical protein [Methanomicrobiales archaeon]